MSSILTNNSAMVALQTLKGINSSLSKTQTEISTGKSISSAKDNSAVWAISKVMESDVAGFKAVSESLALGQSTVAVARNAAETVTDLLTEMKGRIVAAQEENVDRDAIQADIDALEDQISSVVNAAQFNGLNLVDGASSDAVNVLSSLDRDSNGNVTDRQIQVARQNLSVTGTATAASFGTTDMANQAEANAYMQFGADNTNFADATNYDPDTVATATSTIASGANSTVTIGQVSDGVGYRIILDDVIVNVAGGGTTQGTRTFEYVAGIDDSASDVAANLTNQINAFFGAATDSADAYTVTVDPGSTGADNTFQISNGASGTTMRVFAEVLSGGAASSGGTNGLAAVNTIDVTSDAGATGALGVIDGLIQQSIDAAASFGSAQNRIETQSNFVSELSDSLKSGIGSLVDADMEEASAKLQALQVQQQLAIQSLSIANQAPQSILSLFR